MAIVNYFVVDWIWYANRILPVFDSFRITKLEKKCSAMPISCLSIGFAACQSCLSGKVNYAHWVEGSGRIIPFSHANLSIISYEKCINRWLKFVSTKSIRTASRKYCFPWNKVCPSIEFDDFGVPDLLINHGYALSLGLLDRSSSTLITEHPIFILRKTWLCRTTQASIMVKVGNGRTTLFWMTNLLGEACVKIPMPYFWELLK